jgi:hypothetical protein
MPTGVIRGRAPLIIGTRLTCFSNGARRPASRRRSKP